MLLLGFQNISLRRCAQKSCFSSLKIPFTPLKINNMVHLKISPHRKGDPFFGNYHFEVLSQTLEVQHINADSTLTFLFFSYSPRRVRETRPGAVETWEQVGCAVLHVIVGRFWGIKDWKEWYMELFKRVFDATVSFTSRMCPCT